MVIWIARDADGEVYAYTAKPARMPDGSFYERSAVRITGVALEALSWLTGEESPAEMEITAKKKANRESPSEQIMDEQTSGPGQIHESPPFSASANSLNSGQSFHESPAGSTCSPGS